MNQVPRAQLHKSVTCRWILVFLTAILFVTYYSEHMHLCQQYVALLHDGDEYVQCLDYDSLPLDQDECENSIQGEGCEWIIYDTYYGEGWCMKVSNERSAAKCKYTPYPGSDVRFDKYAVYNLAPAIFWGLVLIPALFMIVGSATGLQMAAPAAWFTLFLWFGLLIMDLWTIAAAHHSLYSTENETWSDLGVQGNLNLPDYYPLKQALFMIGTFCVLAVPTLGATIPDSNDAKSALSGLPKEWFMAFCGILWSIIALCVYSTYYTGINANFHYDDSSTTTTSVPQTTSSHTTSSPDLPKDWYSPIRYLPFSYVLMDFTAGGFNVFYDHFPPVLYFVVIYAGILLLYMSEFAMRLLNIADLKPLFIFVDLAKMLCWLLVSIGDWWYIGAIAANMTTTFDQADFALDPWDRWNNDRVHLHELSNIPSLGQAIVWMMETYLLLYLAYCNIAANPATEKVAKSARSGLQYNRVNMNGGNRALVGNGDQEGAISLKRQQRSVSRAEGEAQNKVQPSQYEPQPAYVGLQPAAQNKVQPPQYEPQPAYVSQQPAAFQYTAIINVESPSGPLSSWTSQQLGNFIGNIGTAYRPYVQAIVSNGIDGKMISDGFVTADDLKEVAHITHFHSRIILRKLEEHGGMPHVESKEDELGAPPPASDVQGDLILGAPPPPASQQESERDKKDAPVAAIADEIAPTDRQENLD